MCKWIEAIVGIILVIFLIPGNLSSAEKSGNSKRKQLVGNLSIYPNDADKICEVEGLPLTRGEIRKQAVYLRDIGPALPMSEPTTLTPDEAFKQAFTIAFISKAKDAEAIRRGIEVSIEDATFVRDKQRELCQQKECIDLIKILSEAEGITIDEYWETAIAGYQQSARRLKLMDLVLEEEGPGKSAPPEEQREFYVKWEQELLDRASIQWFDPKMERKYPDALKFYKRVVKEVGERIKGER